MRAAMNNRRFIEMRKCDFCINLMRSHFVVSFGEADAVEKVRLCAKTCSGTGIANAIVSPMIARGSSGLPKPPAPVRLRTSATLKILKANKDKET